MTLQIKDYARKPFNVKAVQVTDRNFSEVVTWCEGTAALDENHRRFIKVPVKKPINQRQTTAYVGDFIVLQRKEFKVFKNSSFRSTFDEINDLIAEQLATAGHLELPFPGPHTPASEEEQVKATPPFTGMKEKLRAEQEAMVKPRQKHGQNGWNTKVQPTNVPKIGMEIEKTEEQVMDEFKESKVIVVNEDNHVIPGYTYEEAMAAARAGDGNVRQQLDELVLLNEGIVYDWNAPAGHELDEAIRQGKAQPFTPLPEDKEPFNTDDAAVTVVQVNPEAVLVTENPQPPADPMDPVELAHKIAAEWTPPHEDERNYPREVEEDRPIGI